MDKSDDEEDYWERFDAEAKILYETSWIMEGYNTRDEEEKDTVALFDNKYFILSAYGDDLKGPYDTLEAAVLAGELNYVYEFTFRIDAPTLNDERLQELLYYAGTLKHTLTVNGKQWRTIAGRKLEPVPEENNR